MDYKKVLTDNNHSNVFYDYFREKYMLTGSLQDFL